uniref:Uncharacterized protein n=1 Tax=Octopus bimaculoides TaxID=37653 RepID=A0A0L8IG09_OCTBM
MYVSSAILMSANFIGGMNVLTKTSSSLILEEKIMLLTFQHPFRISELFINDSKRCACITRFSAY